MDYSKELKNSIFMSIQDQVYNHACVLESFDILKEFYAEFKQTEKEFNKDPNDLSLLAKYHSNYLNLYIIFQQTSLLVELFGGIPENNVPENNNMNMILYTKIKNCCKIHPVIDENNQFLLEE